jgi:hypothetical protein
VGEQGFEGEEVVALHEQAALTPIPSSGGRGERGVRDRQLLIAFEQMKRHFFMVVDDGVLADPVEGGHSVKVSSSPKYTGK